MEASCRKTFKILINLFFVTTSFQLGAQAQDSSKLVSLEAYQNALSLISSGFQYKAEAQNKYVPEAVSAHSPPGTNPATFASKYSIDFKASASGAYECLMETINGKGEFMERVNCGYDSSSYYCLSIRKDKKLTTTIDKNKAEKNFLWQIGHRELLTFLLGFANPPTQLDTNNIPPSRGVKDILQALKVMQEASFVQGKEGRKNISINAKDVQWEVSFDGKRLFPQSVEYFNNKSILFKCTVSEWQSINNVDVPATILFEQYDYYSKILLRTTTYKVTKFSFGVDFTPKIPFSEAPILHDLDSNTTQVNP